MLAWKKYKRKIKYNISESYVKGILNNKFNIKYSRAIQKTNKFHSKSSKLRKSIFVKFIIHALKLGLKIIYRWIKFSAWKLPFKSLEKKSILK